MEASRHHALAVVETSAAKLTLARSEGHLQTAAVPDPALFTGRRRVSRPPVDVLILKRRQDPD
jgi:hypothetical protein